MKAWTKARVASVVRDRRTDRSWRSWKKPARQTAEMCIAIVSWPSRMTPRSFAVDTMSTIEDDVVVPRGSWETVSLASWCRELIQATSVGSSRRSASDHSAPSNDQVARYIRPNLLRLADSRPLEHWHILTVSLVLSFSGQMPFLTPNWVSPF